VVQEAFSAHYRPAIIEAHATRFFVKGSVMTVDAERANLLKVKLALAEKYESLARQAKGKTKQKKFLYDAGRYRRAAATLMAPK